MRNLRPSSRRRLVNGVSPQLDARLDARFFAQLVARLDARLEARLDARLDPDNEKNSFWMAGDIGPVKMNYF